RKRVADLDRAQHAARRSHQHRGEVLHALTPRAPAQLGRRYPRGLAGEEQEQVEAVRPEVTQAAAAGRLGIEHPRRGPAAVAGGGRAVQPEVDVREGTESTFREELPGARDEGMIALAERDG